MSDATAPQMNMTLQDNLLVVAAEESSCKYALKILKQIKGIKTVEVSDEDKTYSWEEIENSEAFSKVIEQSRNQIKNGEYEEFSDELLDSIFNKK